MSPARVWGRLVPAACLILLWQAPAYAQDVASPTTPVPAVASTVAAPLQRLPTVHVMATSIEGFRRPPPHAYGITAQVLEQQPATNFPDLLAEHLPGITLTHEQGNPLQPTLRFNGFSASPLLGTPQGLSVFLDGVRVNEPFGDTVNWDLVPTEALRSLHLVPITDPVFGLNTLGGAIIMRTQNGWSAPGGHVGVEFGSFGTTREQARYGTHHGLWSYLLAAQNLYERGVAPFSASRNRNLFGKITRQTGGNHFDFSYTFAQSKLAGAQTLPRAWINTPRAIYTAPDIIRNALNFFNLGDAQVLNPHWQVAVRLYLRNSNQTGFNSNVNGDYDGRPPTLTNPVANNVVNGLHQQSHGLNLALHHDSVVFGLPNHASVGLSVDYDRIDYTQIQQAATFTPQRYTLGIGPFNQAPANLRVLNRYRGIYFTDRLRLTPWLELSAGGRYQRTHINMTDRLGGALGGRHNYLRFVPSMGLDLHPSPRASYYLRYAAGLRVPMPVELTCASPNAPCTLPNALVADPNLQPVIARTVQTGGVWHMGWLRVHAEYTRTRLRHAIQYISLANMTQGFFTNIPREQFRTLTLDLHTGRGRWLWTLSLSHTLATYQSTFLELSPSNSSAGAHGNILVRAGDHLPNIPEWDIKLLGQIQFTRHLWIHASLLAYSARYAQGDANNQDRHGQVPGYAVVNLGVRYQLGSHWHLNLSIHNLFNRVYTDFGQLGVNEFTAPNRGFNTNPTTWSNTQFVAPGAPRGLWLGVSYAWL